MALRLPERLRGLRRPKRKGSLGADEDGVFMVVEAVLVAVIILTAIIFFTSVQRPVRSGQEGSTNLAQIAADALGALRETTFPDPAGGPVLDLRAWATRVAAGDTPVATDLDEFLRQLVPPGARYELRLNNGFGTTTLLPLGGSGTPAGAQGADTPLFPVWTANSEQSRTVLDGVWASGSTTLTSSTAYFLAGDVGKSVFGVGIPAGATVAAVGSVASVTISAETTAANPTPGRLVIDVPSARPAAQVAASTALYGFTQAATTQCIRGPVPEAATVNRARTVTDGVTVAGATTMQSADADFAAADIGKLVGAVGIPPGTTIASVTDETTVELSAEATSAWTGRLSIIDLGSSSSTVTDGATTSGSTSVTSATANFGTSDAGKPISGAGIPAGATIVSRTDPTTVVISAAATATAMGVTVEYGATWIDMWQGQTPGEERVPASAPYGVWAGFQNADCSGAVAYARVSLREVPPPDNFPIYGLQLVIWYGA